MATDDGQIYRQQVLIAAGPDAVFDFLVDADAMVRWIGIETKVDPTPGGELLIDMNGQDVVRGEYIVVDRPHRVVFTWGYDGSSDMGPGSSTVEITLAAKGPSTILELTHHDCPPDRLADHAGGWKHYLDRLTIEATSAAS